MTTELFADGYVEWTGHDEDGPVDGFAEVTRAKLEAEALDVRLEYDGSEYEIRLTREAAIWSGRFQRRAPGASPAFGRCTAEARPSDPSERRFGGKWIEDGVHYRWELLLRSGIPKKGVSSALPSASSTRSAKNIGALTNEATKEKIRRVIRALDDLVAGRAASPQLVEEALRIHTILERGAKRRRRKAWL